MTQSFLSTNRLCRYYQRGPQVIKAVDELSFSIARGEFAALVGASGSGKSTVLNLLAGLDTPTSGSIECADLSLASMSRRALSAYRAKQVGMVFQSFNLLTHRTALENVELALYFNGTLKRERRDRAANILDRLGMADRLHHRPSDLSGGEQQRVAIARALVKQPAILFADEPTGNLDRENTAQIVALLKELNGEGLTILMVTHNLETAYHHARRVIRMEYGRIVEDASTSQEHA